MSRKAIFVIFCTVASAFILGAAAFANEMDNRTQALEATASAHGEKLKSLDKILPMVQYLAAQAGYAPAEMGTQVLP